MRYRVPRGVLPPQARTSKETERHQAKREQNKDRDRVKDIATKTGMETEQTLVA